MATNKIHVIGRLTADPELKDVNGVSCVNFNLASDTRNKDASGENTTNFYRVTGWRKTADTMAKYLHKGDKIYVEGELVIRTYKTNDGETRTSVNINVSDFEFIQTRRNDGDAEAKPAQQKAQGKPAANVQSDDDELPF